MRASSATDLNDAVAIRTAGADLLSLALIDARNRSLRWLSAFDGFAVGDAQQADVDPPSWLVGHAGWFQEYWIARNVQRGRGRRCPADGLRLASIAPRADALFDPGVSTRAERWSDVDAIAAFGPREYLAETLEATLDLLDKAGDGDDDALYFFRLALWHEDRLAERLAEVAQAVELPADRSEGLWHALPVRAVRDAVWFPAQRVVLGGVLPGFVPDTECGRLEQAVPEFEIDAQAVSWAQYLEFSADGGYDEREWWTDAGWAWATAQARRAPRYVEQIAHGVLARRQGRLQRLPAAQAVLHVSVHEAEAWCRWSGRRLPTEAEWAIAAQGGGSRGFVWGDVAEWVAGSARSWPGAEPGPARLGLAQPARDGVERGRTLRGASFAGVPRLRHPAARRHAGATQDAGFCGFRSCAI